MQATRPICRDGLQASPRASSRIPRSIGIACGRASSGRRAAAPLPKRGTAAAAAKMTDSETSTVWALDFDGMLCDSVGESALSGWKAAVKLWPETFTSAEAEAQKDAVVEAMRIARPVIETGYENVPMVRAILDGMSPEEMLESWGTILPELMDKYGMERSEMVDLFGSTRDDWIREDLQGWLAPNKFYPGIAESTKEAFDGPGGDAMYIVTTKQARFTEALMRDMAGIPFPLDRIFSQTVSGRPKSEVLAMLQERHPNAKSYRFFEDKMSTLEKMEDHEGHGGLGAVPCRLGLQHRS